MQLRRWFTLAIRLVLAAVFILYGVLKLLGLQLSTGDLSDMHFGDASPMLVTWHFFSLSPLYHNSIGVAQIITGLLLVFSRTAPVGALCFFVIVVNIVLINFGYDIATDVKILQLRVARPGRPANRSLLAEIPTPPRPGGNDQRNPDLGPKWKNR